MKKLSISQRVPTNITANAAEQDLAGARNPGVDILKVLCSFMVVFLHAPLPGVIGDTLYMICRVAVPIFLMITGFFYTDTVRNGKTLKQIKKIFRLFLLSNLLFLLADILLAVVSKDLTVYFSELLHPRTLLRFFVLNDSPVGYHLWYLGALLYALVIMAFVYKDKTKRLLWLLIPVLLLTDLLLGEYSMLVFNKTFPVCYARNFVFVGCAYFLIGTLIREILPVIKRSSIIYILSIVFLLLTVVERFVLEANGLSTPRHHNIGTTLLAVSLFLSFLLFFERRKRSRFTQCMEVISVKYSLWIYILHPLVVVALGMIVPKLHIGKLYSYIRCFVVYFATLVFLMVVERIFRHFPKACHSAKFR